jgi:hypothetical protein
MIKRPITITVLSLLLIAVGVGGIAINFSALKPPELFDTMNIVILLVRLLGIACGIFLLRRHDWARWATLAWIASHVAIGFLNSVQKGVAHCVILALIGWILFRPQATAWFRNTSMNP